MNIKTPRIILGATLALILLATAHGAVTLPPVIADGMVLQRDSNAAIWGSAAPGEEVTVSFRDKTAKAKADGDGKWQVAIATAEAGGPFSMEIKGANTIAISDILVGDVWLASGQSNMARAGATNTPPEAQGKVRLFTDKWDKNPSRATIVGWQFALALHKSEGIPMAVLSESVGGTPIRRWYAVPDGKTDNDLYKKHVAPLVPFAIKGAIWWQGETDRYSALKYEDHLSKLIREWREVFSQGDFPFLFVQLQNVGDKPGGYIDKWRGWDLLRVGQMRTLALPNTGMAVTVDFTTGDVHPPMDERMKVVDRLVRIAKATVYGHEEPYMGPLVESAALENEKVVVRFSHTDGGLRIKGNAVNDLDIKAKGGAFRPAKASIDGSTLVVDTEGLTPPVFVRYAIRQYTPANLFNGQGLPASPFITDAVAPGKPWKHDMPKSADFPTEGQTPVKEEPKAVPATQANASAPQGELVIDEFGEWKNWKRSGVSNCEAKISTDKGIATIEVPREDGKRDIWAAGKTMPIPVGGQRTLKVRLRATKGERVEIRIRMEDGKLHSISKYAKASGDWQTMEFPVTGQKGSLIYLILGETDANAKSEAPTAVYEFDRLWIE